TGGRGVFSNALKQSEPSTSASNTTSAASSSQWDIDPQGQALYNQYCLACHQIDGSGVPNMQPSLIDSKRLSSHDNDFLIRLALQGSQWIENRQYNNLMASFAFLSDKEIAQALNYTKARFANSEPTITAQDVDRLRNRYVGTN
ncbi:MAG: cytochrome c, partial [Opitutales bacterium]|nr:cytochrome c [Opitutales bacterium]